MDIKLRFNFAGVIRSDGRCTITLKKSYDTMFDNSLPVKTAQNLDQCIQACVDNDRCTGIDYSHDKEASIEMQKKHHIDAFQMIVVRPLLQFLASVPLCSIVGPWSGQRKSFRFMTHYDVIRNCPTSKTHRGYVAIDKMSIGKRERYISLSIKAVWVAGKTV